MHPLLVDISAPNPKPAAQSSRHLADGDSGQRRDAAAAITYSTGSMSAACAVVSAACTEGGSLVNATSYSG